MFRLHVFADFSVFLLFWRVDDFVALSAWDNKKLIGKSRGLSSNQGCRLGHTALLVRCFSKQYF
jgi:hypothetical protein